MLVRKQIFIAEKMQVIKGTNIAFVALCASCNDVISYLGMFDA